MLGGLCNHTNTMSNLHYTNPRIYVGTYHKYNSGSIGGAWLDLEDYSTKAEFLDACRGVHADERDPELMHQDFEGFPRAFYSESFIHERLFEFVQLDESDRRIWAAYLESGGDPDNGFDAARDAYAGEADSPANFVEELAEETECVPKDLPNWIVIDWDATWNCNLRYDYHTPVFDEETGTYIFFHNS
jgi:antirestriction protein